MVDLPPAQKKTKIIPVILAGGIGSRLWPLSRKSRPKPFIRLDDGQSLLQKTYLRAASIPDVEAVVTVTNRELFFYTQDEYLEVKNNTITHDFILEPFGRNSAAAIALAAQRIHTQYGEDALLLVLPADHLIKKQAQFLKALTQAKDLAVQDKLVTFGIQPDTPKTGYGYIEHKENAVLRFIEKPSSEKAQQYLEAGNFLWNSGMFCMPVKTLLNEMQAYCPGIAEQSKICMENAEDIRGNGWTQHPILAEDFAKIEEKSIDYAVFEHSIKVAVVPCDIGWSDIGSWTEFGHLHCADDDHNHIHGEAVLEDVQNCIIHSEHKVTAGLGLRDLIVADTNDALLIADRNRAQDVRLIVERLKDQGHTAYKSSPMVHRPWGTYLVLQEGPGFKLKRIEVKPGAALSLQLHHHRSEHWIVVSGRAKVLKEEEGSLSELFLNANQSTYIPIKHKHRLENPDHEPLILIEVQCGSYLGEDDILRFDMP